MPDARLPAAVAPSGPVGVCSRNRKTSSEPVERRVSTEDVETLIAEQFYFLVEGSPCDLREKLLAGVRQTLHALDGLDREHHPVWVLLAVQTVNASRLHHYVRWLLRQGEADEATDLTIVVQDLAAGCLISNEAWVRLAERDPSWRLEPPLVQGFFNFHLFGAGSFLNDLKRLLVDRDQVDEALAYLRRPETVESPSFRWLTPNATTADLLSFAEMIDAAAY